MALLPQPCGPPSVNGNGTYASRPKSKPFAGRLGGNLSFCEVHDSVLKRTPDAAPLTSIRAVIDLVGFKEPIYVKAAIIECAATFLQTYTAGMVDNAFGSYIGKPNTSPVGWNMAHQVLTWLLISLFLYAAGPASGGHLNPFITMLTFTAGLCTLPRMVYYIIGQMVGALGGAFFLKLGLGGSRNYYPSGIVGGCTIDFNAVPSGQAYALELGVYLVVAFLAFGVGLDPRQGQVFGPALAPILVGAVVALGGFGTGDVRPGWTGASINPVRCFGLMAAKGHLFNNWVHWTAAITASILHGVLYGAIPPHPRD